MSNTMRTATAADTEHGVEIHIPMTPQPDSDLALGKLLWLPGSNGEGLLVNFDGTYLVLRSINPDMEATRAQFERVLPLRFAGKAARTRGTTNIVAKTLRAEDYNYITGRANRAQLTRVSAIADMHKLARRLHPTRATWRTIIPGLVPAAARSNA